MSNAISVIIGILGAVLMCVALVPLLGWLNWLVLAGCVFGIIFGAVSEKKSGLTINAAVAAVGMLRLLLGGGIL
ncbi:MAG: hypothetical protein HKN82_15070 [Akkermansiaceae bacterium]|nr:hypothetical protein [Akkermansiaceae bacterium]NNM29867.1 hypothetical protein [Akkermansiaceae bacterium]